MKVRRVDEIRFLNDDDDGNREEKITFDFAFLYLFWLDLIGYDWI